MPSEAQEKRHGGGGLIMSFIETNVQLSLKQAEYIRNACSRWNFK